MAIFGPEIVIFDSKGKIRLKNALKISVEWPVFKGFTFFSFLILRPGEDYNLYFRSWSAQVKCQRTVLGCRGGNLGQAAGSGDLYID